jgi:hypothetical protein
MTLEELKALYGEKGAMEQRVTQTEQGDIIDYIPVQLGDGWTAYENQPQIIGYEGQGENATPIYAEPEDKLGGFQRSEGNKNYFYDTSGNLVHVEKQSTDWDVLGPIIMGAATMGGGAGMLGNSLFGLTGNAAAGAGGALLGGANAAFTDQDILKGALLGGAAGAGGAQLGDTGFTVSDAVKALKFAENPTLAGAASLASPYVGSTEIGDTGMSIGDVFKNVGTAQALASGDERQIFNALKGLAGDKGGSLKSSLAGFEANPEDFIEGYFQPGGEGYIDPTTGEMTVREEPDNIDSLLRMLSPYAMDGGTSVFTQGEDIPELETVAKRPVSLVDILGTPDILQGVDEDVPELTITGGRPQTDVPEMVITDERPDTYVPSIRTKEIVSDIPDFITPDQIDRLNLDTKIEDILQMVTPTKTVTPGGTKTTAPAGTQTTKQALANLGLGGMQQAASQDPYADIKLMQEMFGPNIAYKLLSLGGNKRK